MMIIVKLLITLIGVLVCIASGLFLAYTFWPPASGRDFRSGATIAGILISLFSIFLRAKYKWSLTSLLVSLIPVEVVTMFMIMSGSGSFSIDNFNLRWLTWLNLYIALPWLIGIGIGSILSRINLPGEEQT